MAASFSEDRVGAIQDAYRIGFLMEDVRISFKKDFKISVEGIQMEANEGDILSIPRWIAKILLFQGIIEVQDSDSSVYLSRAMNRERISKPHDLSTIDMDFYVRVGDYLDRLGEIEGLREEGGSSTEMIGDTGRERGRARVRERIRERENLVISLNTFVVSRLEKIVKLAAASPLSPEIEGRLSAEEKELYIVVHRAASEFKQRVLKRFG